MIIGIYLSVLALILIGMTGVLFFVRVRRIQATKNLRAANQVDVSRYQPMLRLLSADDLSLVKSDKTLEKQLRVQRSRVVRGYLRCMTKDFAALHAALRQIMVEANEDRPDLAMMLMRSQYRFTLASCRIEVNLWLYQFGIGTMDLSNLVQQVTAVGRMAQAISQPV